jgi:hypothetical protein
MGASVLGALLARFTRIGATHVTYVRGHDRDVASAPIYVADSDVHGLIFPSDTTLLSPFYSQPQFYK